MSQLTKGGYPQSTINVATLQDVIKATCSRITANLRDRVITPGELAVCETALGVIQCDESSRINITGAVVQAGLIPSTFSIPWTFADNTIVILDAAAMVTVGQTVAAHVAATHIHARSLKDTVIAATSVAEVQAVDIESGW